MVPKIRLQWARCSGPIETFRKEKAFNGIKAVSWCSFGKTPLQFRKKSDYLCDSAQTMVQTPHLTSGQQIPI